MPLWYWVLPSATAAAFVLSPPAAVSGQCSLHSPCESPATSTSSVLENGTDINVANWTDFKAV